TTGPAFGLAQRTPENKGEEGTARPLFLLTGVEGLGGRPCRSLAPGARGIRRHSLDGRSWTNTGTHPMESETGRRNDACSEGQPGYSLLGKVECAGRSFLDARSKGQTGHPVHAVKMGWKP